MVPPTTLPSERNGEGKSREARRAAPHTHPVLASGQLGCQAGARPSSQLLGLTIPAFVRPAQAWLAPHRPKGLGKPEQLEPHQVFFQAGQGALRRQRQIQREESSFVRLFIHSFLGQIIFIEHPLCGRHCARFGGFSGGLSPGPHPSYLLDANMRQQTLSPFRGGWAWSLGQKRSAWGREGEDATKAYICTPGALPLQGSWGRLEEGSLRAPPTRCCWSPGPRTSPSSRRSPVLRARSGRSGRQAHSR